MSDAERRALGEAGRDAAAEKCDELAQRFAVCAEGHTEGALQGARDCIRNLQPPEEKP